MSELSEKDEQGFEDRGGDLVFWIGLLLPPTAWALQLQIVYLTSEFGCYTSNFLWNHVVSGAAILISALGVFLSYTKWRSLGGGAETSTSFPEDRKRFMAIGGMPLGTLFTLLIFAQWLPTLLGVPCEK